MFTLRPSAAEIFFLFSSSLPFHLLTNCASKHKLRRCKSEILLLISARTVIKSFKVTPSVELPNICHCRGLLLLCNELNSKKLRSPYLCIHTMQCQDYSCTQRQFVLRSGVTLISYKLLTFREEGELS